MTPRFPLGVLIAFAIVMIPPANAWACEAAGYDPANEPPFGGEPPGVSSAPDSKLEVPRGLTLTGARAERIAREALGSDLDSSDVRRVATRYAHGDGVNVDHLWKVDFFDGDGDAIAQVWIRDEGGCVIEQWTGSQVDTKLARGYEDAIAGDVNEWWFWLPLCFLFIAPFVDPRRPFRLVHLDL